MNRKISIVVVVVGCLVGIPALGLTQSQQGGTSDRSSKAPAASTQAKARTIENLRSAAGGEANAAHRYDLFAQKADEEGYGQVAALFRAAALSERIHLRNHEAVLSSLGVAPAPLHMEQVKVRTTRENLLVPIEGEKGEATQMYPNYARQAQEAGLPNAALTFTYAGETEKKHEQLFQSALNELGRNPKVDYLVQSESGMLVTQSPSRVAAVTAPSSG